jgi:hypothetical protein
MSLTVSDRTVAALTEGSRSADYLGNTHNNRLMHNTLPQLVVTLLPLLAAISTSANIPPRNTQHRKASLLNQYHHLLHNHIKLPKTHIINPPRNIVPGLHLLPVLTPMTDNTLNQLILAIHHVSNVIRMSLIRTDGPPLALPLQIHHMGPRTRELIPTSIDLLITGLLELTALLSLAPGLI